MEFKGTKGKWERVGSIVYLDDNSKTIYPYYECGGFGIEKEANALLISKSPEMLEMLKELLCDLEDVSIPTSMDDTLKRTKQLIKEATEL